MLTPRTFNGALPGLQLKAWARFAANGTLISGSNVTSITKGGTGIYQLNFTTNLLTNTYIARAIFLPVDGTHAVPTIPHVLFQGATKTTAAFEFRNYYNGALSDQQGFIEVYEG